MLYFLLYIAIVPFLSSSSTATTTTTTTMFPLLRLRSRRRRPVQPRDPVYSGSNSYDSFDSDDDGERSLKEKCMPWLNKSNSKHKHERKLRLSPEISLLCSYGGHFKNEDNFSGYQKYTGCDNRLVTVNRHCSAAKLFRHLSTTIFGNDSSTSFTLKYHLSSSSSSPSSNSLISVVTDEDLQHMIKAFDRIPTYKNPRYLRVFLIPNEINDHPEDQTDKNNTFPSKLPPLPQPPPPPPPPRAIGDPKLRLMCRTGGRFYFYPCHSSQPAYVGGVNRIVVMDPRPSSLAQLFSHLSRVLFNGDASFTVKYCTPCDGLNCLISLSTDEDFRNMIDLCNIYSSSPSKPINLRLHFFPLETSEEAAPSESDSGVISNSKEESEPVLYRAEVQVVPDPNCRFQMQQIQNSGDLSPLDPFQVRKMQQMARAGTLCIDHATGEIPLVSSMKSSPSDDLLPSAGQASNDDTNEAVISEP